MVRAYLHHERGAFSERDDCLKASLIASRQGGALFLRWVLAPLPELFQLAIEKQFEPEYVAALIHRLRTPPPETPVASWPWAVRIYTLGRFEIHVDGKPVNFGRKAPKRVLQLLKAVVAMGNGVATAKIVDHLWPDLDGDAAHEALAVALHRLRQIVGSAEAVRLAQQRLCLNQRLVWVDAWAFEKDVVSTEPICAERLSLYRGVFLPQDKDEPFAITARERLRTKYIHAVERLGAEFERRSDYVSALALYRLGTEADELAEELFRGLMRCCLNLERRAEGMAAFRRLRQALWITMGISPAGATQSLAEQLGNP
jgi:DNA-binding SARP family transcriptional activator